jgi:threonine dehydratase
VIQQTVPAADRGLVTLDAIREAATGLRGVAERTPLLPVEQLSAAAGVPVYLKLENRQPTGAFKLRGAWTAVRRLSVEARRRGVITYSSGNHGQAVAYAARRLGLRAVVVMPETAPPLKVEGVKKWGGEVVFAGTTSEDRKVKAEELIAAQGLAVVPPFDDPDVIAGQGTVGLEIVEDLPAVDTVLVPVGGGGLSAGVATAVKTLAPRARVVGVEPAGAPKLTRARDQGAPVRLDSTRSMADGLLAVEVGAFPFAHHEAYIDDVVLVEDAALREAVRFLLDRVKVVAEPSGAITVAALLQGLVRPGGPVVAVLSGGNIEWPGLRQLLADG